MRHFKCLFMIFTLFFANFSIAKADMIIKDIKVEGSQYVAKSTVLNYLPLKIGQTFSFSDSHIVINRIYETGFFKDVRLYQNGNTLIIEVKEQPIIAKIEYKGNLALPDESLDQILNDIQLKKGKIFNPSKLEALKFQLQEFYFSRGYYSSKVTSKIKKLKRNRIEIEINIHEGEVALIRDINIVGNVRFDEKFLLSKMELEATSGALSDDEYSKNQLEADLETIRSYYMDRGHFNFNIKSTEVTISPNKKNIYININQIEGDIYNISTIKLHGTYHLTDKEIRKQFKIKTTDVYSRTKIQKTVQAIKDRFGEDGYAFAIVEVVPTVDEKNKSVSLDFYIKPKQKVFVRRINITGNEKTYNEVFRRELRQMESSVYSPKKMKRSKIRIQRLSYVETVDIKTIRIPNKNDQVDLEVRVKEMPSGSFTVGGAYSSAEGFTFTTNFAQNNMFGTGESFKMGLSKNSVSQNFSMATTNPYWTDDGISRSFSYYYNDTDASEISTTASYFMNSYGVSVNFGIPMAETETIFLGAGYDNTKLGTTISTPDEINSYIDLKGDEYSNIFLSMAYVNDWRNRTIFATEGAKNRLSFNVTVPGSGLEYYKSSYEFEYYYPLSERYTFNFHNNVSYGDSYVDDYGLPFFKKYYVGGVYSLRGYSSSGVGPKDEDGKATGGNLKTTGSFELVFPPAGVDITGPTRFSLFTDFGSVYKEIGDFDSNELRYSAGIAFKWFSAMGPLVFSFAEALNPDDGDKTEVFQFYVGGVF